MGLLHEIECAKCGVRDVVEQKRRAYRLEGGGTLPVDAGLAWCRGCYRVVEGELFESVSALRRSIETLQQAPPSGDRFADLLGLTRDEEIALLRDRLRWRQARRGPPRCLECGHESPDFMMMDDKAQGIAGRAGRLWVEHPFCLGRLTARAVGDRPSDDRAIEYSAEGERLS
ncbi:MAG: hypothetical protein HUU15_05135 [Candidatus Brocadiae bacterium]|nr:hypothetical protein [Candidatus Brocadiia bacterium]